MYRFRDTLPIDISRKTISGDLVTIDNSEEMGVVDSLEVSLSPIQDLNGYDKPWVGGAGKNKVENASDSYSIANATYHTYTVPKLSTYSNKEMTFSIVTSDIKGKRIALYKNGDLIKVGSYGVKSVTATMPTLADTDTLRLYLQDYTADAVAITGAQLELGSTATDYEPYSNICPISGHTEVDVVRTGVNVWDEEWEQGGINVSTGGNQANLTRTRSKNYISVRPSTSYYFRIGTNEISNGLVVAEYDSEKTFIQASWKVSPTVTVGTNTLFVRFATGDAYGGTYQNDISINYPSTDHDYHAYQGTTYTTALGRTVYGGTLDVVSGVLTVDRITAEYDGSNDENWAAETSSRWQGANFYIAKPMDMPRQTTGVMLNFTDKVSLSYSQDGLFISASYLNFLIGQMLGISDVATFRTWLSNNPIQVSYLLATPQTYQLTPQQIELLVGNNNVWSDGEISVVWHKDLTKGRILPTEAVSINGQYIENVLDGYRTLYTKGRESLGAKLETYSIGTADGEKFKNKRYPARTITVGFQLIGANPQDFRQKFNNLNNLLSIDEADFIFNDETDKFFSGYPIMDASVEAGQDSVKGEWKIYCTYPFKRSVEPIKLTMEDATVTDTTATFTIDYKGARPARPVLRAKFAGAKSGGSSSEDGDCGFVAFMDGEENIIQLGNPEIVDLDEYVSAETLLNKEFVNVSDWTRTGGHTYKGTVTGSVSTSDTVDAFWNGGAGQTQTYAKPSYGSGSDLHGAILWKNTAGAVNFTMNMVHRLCCANPNETGVFECGAYNHDTGVLVAGFVIDKSANGTTGVVRYIVNGVQVGTDQIDLSYYNTHFGYCNRTPVYVEETVHDPYIEEYVVIKRHKKRKRKQRKYITKSRVHWWARTRTVFGGWNYSQSNLNSSIQKDGSYVYFQVGNLPMRTFNVPAVAQVIAHDASVYMGTYGTALNTNMIHSLLFRREAGVPFSEQPNVFTAGDIVEADCNEATVYIYRDGSIGGHLEPQYGALGNDWEDFMLTSGTNVIRATWSEWVNPTYKPQIEIEYNEVYI